MIGYSRLARISNQVRKDVVRSISHAGSGHPGGSLSSVDLLTSLYFSTMRHDPDNPCNPNRDKFILAKGHAAPALYSVLAHAGYFDMKELDNLRKINSMLQGHPSNLKTPGVEVSTGSLGQGLSVGVGAALADRMDGRDARTYVLLGDGELQEGQVWEAAMSASHYNLDNLCAIVDLNGLQIDGCTKDVMSTEPIAAKWKAFGWNFIYINGHDFDDITHSFEAAANLKMKPTVILAKTVKGKGVSFMEDDKGWHGKAPNEDECLQAIQEMEDEIKGQVGGDVVGDNTAIFEVRKPLSELPQKKVPHKPGTQTYKKKEMVATREAYGDTLVSLGDSHPDVVVLDADLSGSTKSLKFSGKFPSRFFNLGIAEQNMVNVAAGMAVAGKVPFASSFAVFITGRCYGQVRNTVAYSDLNVKLVGSHGGLMTGEDGATHIALEDLALMRAIPEMVVISPSDAVQTREAVLAMLEYDGPCYLRTGRGKVPVIYDDDFRFKIGKGYVLRESEKDLAAIIVNGDRTHAVLEVYKELMKKGKHVRVIDMPTVKPIDEDLLEKVGMDLDTIITVEDHSIIGGLGDAVTDVLSGYINPRVFKFGVCDMFGESGSPNDLLKKHMLDKEGLLLQIKELMDW